MRSVESMAHLIQHLMLVVSRQKDTQVLGNASEVAIVLGLNFFVEPAPLTLSSIGSRPLKVEINDVLT